MPPEASAGVPKGTYRKYVPEGVQVPLRARASKSEQCAGFASVSYERKTLQAFFDFRLKRANPSSAQDLRASPMKEKRCRRFSTSDLIRAISSSAGLATSAKREVPRAEIASVSYERKTLQAFFDFRLKRANPSSGRSRYIRAPLTYRIFAVQKYAAVVLRCDTASMPCIEGSSPRHLQRARSAKFPARLATSAKREVPRAANRKPLLLI